MNLFGLVLCFLCASSLDASDIYRAGVLNLDKEINTKELESFVYEAGRKNVDILVLPSSELAENYDETVKSFSKAAKEAKVYLVAHLYEKIRCENKLQVVKSNVVFDREGSIVSIYKKPVSNLGNCSAAPSELVTFTTDFGVTFGLIMSEDVVLHSIEYFKGLKNFVMTGVANDATFLNGPQFFSSWSYVYNANLISNNGIYMARSGLKDDSGNLVIANLNKCEGSGKSVVPNVPTENFKTEDVNQYVVRPLSLEASSRGYKETVCHGTFCCEFYVKTAVTESNPEVSYGLGALDGIYPFNAEHSIGAQSCAVFACAGLYKRSCKLGSSNNSTNIFFEKISITANFTKQNAQYPIVQSTSVLPAENFKFDTKINGISTQVTLEIVDSQNIFKFSIFGRDYSRDLETFDIKNNSESTYDIYDYIFNDDVQGFFDYIWIRLRILLVVVSIYVLEMM